jgi:ureidoglycolate dehydrogenase (NAD+)
MFGDVEEYKEHIDTLIDCLKDLPTADGFDEVLVPGEPENNCYDERARHGIPLPDGTIRNLRGVAEDLKVELPPGLMEVE